MKCKFALNGAARVIGLSLASVFGMFGSASAQDQKQPIYSSDVVTSKTDGHRVVIEVNITGAKDLYLVANDGGDGFSYDWCDWANPKLTGDSQTLSLTELDWEYADSGWGSVNLNLNCDHRPLRIGDKAFDSGIGTHANSVIHFKLPDNHKFKTFSAIAGIDRGGTDQLSDGINKSSVRFMVFTERPPQEYWSRRKTVSSADHLAAKAITQFDVHPDLTVSLFAAEPLLVNPSNIDVDHLGRVWVCEVVNYRGGRNNRQQGDRILIIEDVDGDGIADSQTVFYQGRDIDSAHGICVLGDRVLVSAGSEVFFLIDADHDLKADKKEVLFSGIAGVQHDHGIHAFVFGPDGKLYFNFGNAGQRILDKDGNPIVDAAGQKVEIGQDSYREGMVFRCDLDGSQFETLGWNFRNNWEVCVDSFGRMWQSDNDDDGNRATRINYVMPYGNYGFKDEFTGAGWGKARIGMAPDIPGRHWHLNDPGVVPNLLLTGAGSPTGICVYEGDALPAVFHNQLIHCDAGPNVVRAYPVERSGAGFAATVLPVIDGSKHNQWFRPSDVCVAPDGSLIIADWYDPGVGGHGMGDIEHGRLFRVTAKDADKAYHIARPDFSTVHGSIRALCSPNQATRYLAFQSLMERGDRSIAGLAGLSTDKNPRLRARAIWALSKLAPNSTEFATAIQSTAKDADEAMRACAIRVVRQIDDRIGKARPDASSSVNRELLISLSHRQINTVHVEEHVNLWTQLASQYPAGDRWYLEALGIAAEKNWDACLDSLTKIKNKIEPKAWADIIWRSRATATPDLLAELISQPSVSVDELPRYLRALEFCPDASRKRVLRGLAAKFVRSHDEKSRIVFIEALNRLNKQDLTEELLTRLDQLLDSSDLQPAEQVILIERFSLAERMDQLVALALQGKSEQVGVDAMATLLRIDTNRLFYGRLLAEPDQARFDDFIALIHRTRSPESRDVLTQLVFEESLSLERRKQAVLSLSNSRPGLLAMGKWIVSGQHDPRLDPALSAVLNSSAWPEVAQIAAKHFPLPPSKNDIPLPRIADLLRARGNTENGARVFVRDNLCSKCHAINGNGVHIGPDLSEIGRKLSRQAMFETILFPSAGIGDDYQNWSVMTVDGEMFTGIIVSETELFLELKDAEGLVRKIPTGEIEEKKLQMLSMMPDGMHKDITNQELVDLIDYLMTLKEARATSQAEPNADPP